MNAAEINTEISKVIGRALNEGIAERKVAFETIIGILEVQKQALFDWRAQMLHNAALQEQQQNAPIILTPPNGFRKAT